jgi:hypothetical protein
MRRRNLWRVSLRAPNLSSGLAVDLGLCRTWIVNLKLMCQSFHSFGVLSATTLFSSLSIHTPLTPPFLSCTRTLTRRDLAI